MSEPGSVSRPAYRTDIDGLRAVAVLMVVVYHAQFHGLASLKGGFVGVDIFFVISGYLITGIIHRELEQGRFSFARFYERRVRRIVPALAPVLLFCSIAAYAFLFPAEVIDFANSLIAATLSYSNLYFWTKSSYFDQDFGKLLMHTWSLSVEEQFYLCLPVALYFLRRNTRSLVPYLALAAVISFGTAEWMVLHYDRVGAFYLPYARAWELLVGSLLAIAPATGRLSRLGRELLAIAGMLLIAVAGFRLNSLSPFPGATALLPCVGTALLLATGEDGTLVSRALSIRPLIWIGLISYSVYLWHWPMMLLADRGVGGPAMRRFRGKLFLIALSLTIGWFSWAFVEQPFRLGGLRRLPRRRVFALAGAVGTALIVIASICLGTHGFPDRFSPKTLQLAAYADLRNPLGKDAGLCEVSDARRIGEYSQKLCLSPVQAKRNLLLLGDSHAGALWYGLAHSLPGDHVMEAVVLHGCAFTVGHYDDSPCGKMRRLVYEDFLLTHRVDLVILTQYWGEGEEYQFPDTFNWFHQHGIPLLVVGPVPVYDGSLPILLAMAQKNHKYTAIWERLAPGFGGVDEQLEAHAGTWHYQYLSAYKAICGSGQCALYADREQEVPMLVDTNHLSNGGAQWLTDRWVAAHQLW